MKRRFLDRERALGLRRAIAVAQLVAQSEDALVSYWLERYADGAIAEATAAESSEAKKDEKRPEPAPEPVAAAH